MTESDWLACDDPQPMLDFIQGKVSDRKLRLYGCACCRQLVLWDYYGERDVYEPQIRVAERFAQGDATDEERLKAHAELMHEDFVRISHPQRTTDERIVSICLDPSATSAAMVFADVASENAFHRQGAKSEIPEDWDTKRTRLVKEERVPFATLLRHIVGNPFRPYPAPHSWPAAVVQLADAFREGQDCGFALHDALLEAGQAELAEHFGEKQKHPLGCWALDRLLGKE